MRHYPIPSLLLPFFSLLVLGCALTLLCYLGYWQLSRAKEKEVLYEQQQRMTQSPFSQLDLIQGPSPLARYSSVAFDGQFLNDRIILLDNQTHLGQPGYHVLVPVLLNSDLLIFIHRGWIPLGPSRSELPTISAIPNKIFIEGYLDIAYRNPFIHRAIESDHIQWPLRMQQWDASLLRTLFAKEIYPMLVVLNNQSPHMFVPPPLKTPMTPQRHRAYAVQWFSLAGTLMLLSFFYLKRKKGLHHDRARASQN